MREDERWRVQRAPTDVPTRSLRSTCQRCRFHPDPFEHFSTKLTTLSIVNVSWNLISYAIDVAASGKVMPRGHPFKRHVGIRDTISPTKSLVADGVDSIPSNTSALGRITFSPISDSEAAAFKQVCPPANRVAYRMPPGIFLPRFETPPQVTRHRSGLIPDRPRESDKRSWTASSQTHRDKPNIKSIKFAKQSGSLLTTKTSRRRTPKWGMALELNDSRTWLHRLGLVTKRKMLGQPLPEHEDLANSSRSLCQLADSTRETNPTAKIES